MKNLLTTTALSCCLFASVAICNTASAKETKAAASNGKNDSLAIEVFLDELDDQFMWEVITGNKQAARKLDGLINTLGKLDNDVAYASAEVAYDAKGALVGVMLRDVMENVSGFIIWPEWDAVSDMDLGSSRTGGGDSLGLMTINWLVIIIGDNVREDFDIISGLDLGSGR